jgi:alpha-tubulin suppressor-like RCC1 family protein
MAAACAGILEELEELVNETPPPTVSPGDSPPPLDGSLEPAPPGSGVEPPPAEATPAAAGGWSAISAGRVHVCALTADGRALCWRDATGEWNPGWQQDEPETPAAIAGGQRFNQISAGTSGSCVRSGPFGHTCLGRDRFHTCALTSSGEAYCWGYNRYGQLGDGTTEDRVAPVPVLGGHRFRSISAGNNLTCGLTTEGLALCWGINTSGELGIGSVDDRPHAAPEPNGRGVTAVVAGMRFGCGLDESGHAFCWGDDYQGRLGSDAATGLVYAPSPLPVNGGHRFVTLAAGSTHSCGLTPQGEAYCWGNNLFGGLARDPDAVGASREPLPVPGHRFAALSIGRGDHAGQICGLTPDGVYYCWGGTPRAEAVGLRFQSLSVGETFRCGITRDGEAYCWGQHPARRDASAGDAPHRLRERS